jgi:hypothetical protein
VNKPLDDLIKQADQQLDVLETEIKDKQAFAPRPEEVDRATAARFNRVSNHIASHPIRTAIGSVLIFLFLATSIYMMFTMPREAGPYRVVMGIVQSSAVVWSGRVHWGSVAKEQVVLPDGRTVSVRSDRGLLLKPGTPIAIRLYETGAIAPDQPLQL